MSSFTAPATRRHAVLDKRALSFFTKTSSRTTLQATSTPDATWQATNNGIASAAPAAVAAAFAATCFPLAGAALVSKSDLTLCHSSKLISGQSHSVPIRNCTTISGIPFSMSFTTRHRGANVHERDPRNHSAVSIRLGGTRGIGTDISTQGRTFVAASYLHRLSSCQRVTMKQIGCE